MADELKKVYVLMHTYEYGQDNEHESTKLLGVYSSKKQANEAVKRYRALDGFKKYPLSCFAVNECVLGVDYEWTDGFMTWEEIEEYQAQNNICRGDEYKKSIFEDVDTENDE